MHFSFPRRMVGYHLFHFILIRSWTSSKKFMYIYIYFPYNYLTRKLLKISFIPLQKNLPVSSSTWNKHYFLLHQGVRWLKIVKTFDNQSKVKILLISLTILFNMCGECNSLARNWRSSTEIYHQTGISFAHLSIYLFRYIVVRSLLKFHS